MAICYLFTSVSVRHPIWKSAKQIIPRTEVPISLTLISQLRDQQNQPRSFKEIFLAFPWKDFELVVEQNRKSERLQYTKLFIDELTYFIELEPLVAVNQTCSTPSLPPPSDVNCMLYPKAFNGVKRNQSVKIGALLQFGFDVDVLEIHLNELYGVVDVFFIIESTHAHFGLIKKPLVWEHIQRQNRFSKFPVVHFIIDDAESAKSSDKRWSMEMTQERARWEKFLEWNEQTQYFGDDDVIGKVRNSFRYRTFVS